MQPGADAKHDVGLGPKIVAERQRDAEGIAAVEHAAAAAIARAPALAASRTTPSPRRDASCAPPPQMINGRLAAPRSFAALRTASWSILGIGGPAMASRMARPGPLAPHVDGAFERGRAGTAASHGSDGQRRRPGAACPGFRMSAE